MTLTPIGDAALLVTCAGEPGAQASTYVYALAAALTAAALPGVLALVPAYTTVLVHFDPRTTDLALLAEAVRSASSGPPGHAPADHLAALRSATPPAAARRWHIAAVYDGEDLPWVATQLGCAAANVVARHSAVEYSVACLGFAPGFAYLAGLPTSLHLPRRATPRAQIPAGSLILGGQQTAVMPLAMPSGWHILGRTAVQLFDVSRAAPSLLLPGDRVRFLPTAAADLADAPPRCEVLP